MRQSLREKVVLADNSLSPVCGNDVIRISDQSLGVALITHLIVAGDQCLVSRYYSAFATRCNYIWAISVISIELACEIMADTQGRTIILIIGRVIALISTYNLIKLFQPFKFRCNINHIVLNQLSLPFDAR